MAPDFGAIFTSARHVSKRNKSFEKYFPCRKNIRNVLCGLVMHQIFTSVLKAGMSLHTHHGFQIRLGQTWKVQDKELGLRVCLVDQIHGDQVHMRTVFDEGLIGASETKVPMQILLQRKDRWEYVSEPALRVA